jgi:hypothetical protein
LDAVLFLRPRLDLAGASIRSAGDAWEHSWVEFEQGKLKMSVVRVSASQVFGMARITNILKTYSFMVYKEGGDRCGNVLCEGFSDTLIFNKFKTK